MKIFKKKNKIIVEIDYWQTTTDAIGEEVGKAPNVIGVICQDQWGNQELGLSHLLDRTYKGKDPDISTQFLFLNGMTKDEFRKLCKELEIGCHEYPVCKKCGKDIFGVFTIDKKGNSIHIDCK